MRLRSPSWRSARKKDAGSTCGHATARESRLSSALAGAADRFGRSLRDTALIRVPSFQVAAVDIRELEPAREITLQRSERNWRLVAPIQVPADDDKVEGLVAELTALRVADGTEGFVAADVPPSDLAKYGLDKPSLVLTVTPFSRRSDQPAAVQSLRLGAAVPGKDGQYYAVRGDQDDVVRVDAKHCARQFPA